MPRTRGLARNTSWLMPGLVGVALLGATTLAWTPSADADVESFYNASARSVVVDAYFTNSTIPGGVRPEGGGPQTDVAQSSLDKGDANASFPYFGDYVPTAPGVVSGLFGVPVPPYPLTASSTFGGAPARVNYPGIELSATSRSTSTVADAIAGSAGSGAVSHSEVDESPDGNVVANATASSPLTVLGPLVSLKGFDSAVSVVADANGTLTRTSNFTIDEISIPGLVLRIPEQTPSSYPVPFPVPIPGVPAPEPIPAPPLPIPNGGATLVEPKIGFVNGYFVVTQPFEGETQKYAVPADAVVEAFKAQGVTLAYTAPRELKDGITGGVFTVNYTFPAPPENPFYQGETPATFIVGATAAMVQRAPETAGGPEGGLGAVPAVDAAGAGTGGLPLAPAPATDLAGIGALPATPAGGIPTVDFAPQAGAGDAASGVGAALMSAGLPAFLSSDFSAIYLALVGLTLIGLLAAAVLGAKGVSARWNS
ncbi:hypothetical protein [Sporichthya polymorpha]|uniref:hypothetical protein n=1 Tax=Sporichthya polymorpha TaxID=35751 RepID=UPI0003A52303|nr:hypothetical protein [Sporichthya polymorpha]